MPVRLHLEEMDRLAESFYEAAIRPEMWRSALHKVSEVFGAEGACLLAWPYNEEAAVWSEGLDEMAERFFAEGWHTRNIRLSRGLPLRNTKPILTVHDIFTPEEFDRLPFNAEFINPLGFRWAAGCVLGSDPCAPVGFSAERKARNGPFETMEIEAMTAFLPHMQRAVGVAQRFLVQRGQGMLDAFESMSCAAILIDGLGRVQSLNGHARHLLGRAIQVQQGHLTACHKEANTALQHQLAELLKPVEAKRQATTITVIPRPEGRPLFVYGIPVVRSAQDIFLLTRVILILVDPDAHLNPPELILRQGFKLTPAETRLALAIGQGCRLADYAARHQVSVGTARIQLKQVMAKTSTHRQAELVALLAQLAQALPVRDA